MSESEPINMSDKGYKIIKLGDDNYAIWKWQFTAVMKAKRFYSVLIPKKENEQIDDQLDADALVLLSTALGDENLSKILDCVTFNDAWKKIQQCYENKTAYEPQSLYRRLNSFKIDTASEVSAAISEMQSIVSQLRNLKENVSSNCFIAAILSALPSSFDVFITVWKNSSNQEVDDLVSKLMVEANDQMNKIKQDTSALSVKARDQSKFKENTKFRGEKLEKNQCRYCKEIGHWLKECPNLKEPYDPYRSRKKRNDEFNRDECSTKPLADNQLAFMTSSTTNSQLTNEDFVADTGCTNHMSPYRELFSEIRKSEDIRVVQLADENSNLQVKGVGDIVTDKEILRDVLYVLDLAQNLFSVRAAAN